MADNVTVPATGSGTATPVVATDDEAGVHYQKVKLAAGQTGSTEAIEGTAAFGLEVDVVRGNVGGSAAHDAAVAGNPVAIGGCSNDALPSEVSADAEAVWAWFLRNGAQMTAQLPHLGFVGDPFTMTGKTAQYTTTQTGTALWTPTSGKRLVVQNYMIQVGGTTAGTMQLWFGASADTTYSRGTDLAIFDGEFKPSATLAPGVVQSGGTWIASAVDHVLRVTDSAAINPLTVTIWGYEI